MHSVRCSRALLKLIIIQVCLCALTVWTFQPTTTTTSSSSSRLLSSSKPPTEKILTTVEDSATSSNSSKKPNIVVVGGGVGGLAVATRIAHALSNNTHKVILLEKNDQVGGRCGSFVRNIEGVGDFRHERGPSLLLLPEIYQRIFQECGSCSCSGEDDMQAAATKYGLEMTQCTPAYQVVFEDGDSIQVGFPRSRKQPFTPLEETSRLKMNSWEERGAHKWDEYMRACSAFLDCGLPNFIEERFDLLSFPAFLIESLKDGAKGWPLKPHSDVLDAMFTSNKLKALASFQDLYVGLEPYRDDNKLGGGVLTSTAPAVFGLLAAIEMHPYNSKSGVFAPVGGFQSVTTALEKLAHENRVQLECNKLVSKVTAEGVYTYNRNGDSQLIPSTLTIINADLPYAKASLLSSSSSNKNATDTVEQPTFDWDDRFDFSSGVIAFHWSLNRVCEELNTHNVFLSAGSRDAAEKSWGVIRNNRLKPKKDDPFNFYVHCAARSDPTAAPPGCDTVMVLVPCKTLLRKEEYVDLPREQALGLYRDQFDEEFVGQVRDTVLDRLSVIPSLRNLQADILDEIVDTPATYAAQYHVGAGTPFALSHGFGQLSLTRPGMRSSPFDNVWFCGASSRPGNGVPLVLIGAEQVAKNAIQEVKKRMHDGNR